MSEEDVPEDPLPAMVAALDQLMMVVPQTAKAVHAVYTAYLEAGFSEGQAFEITMAYIHSLVL